jgi:signal transduction histidine kinase
MAVVTTLIGFVVWSSFDNRVVITWMCIGYFVNLSRNYFFLGVKKLAPEESVYSWLELTLATLLFLSGLFWGVTSWLFIDADNMATFVFVALAVVAAAPSAIPVFSALPYMWILYASPLMLITAAKLYSLGYWELSILAIINLVGLTPLSRNLGKTIEKSITLDLKNSELLAEVRDAKEKADKANLAKSQFLAAASHDLRQPLHTQVILLEALNLRLQDPENRDLLEKITHANDALNSLFSALLEISQLDAGTIRVNVSHQPLLEICKQLVDEYQSLAKDNGLHMEINGNDAVAITDPVLLNRILRNLISNAIKFTKQGGIKFHVKSDAEKVFISVSDTGIGIPKSQQQYIFDEYYQLDNKSRDRTKGIGLGLALVRRMCKLLQHDIQVESSAGKGACFTLTLPRGDKEQIIIQQPELSTDSFRHLKILVIDDEKPILEAMTIMLTDWECYPRSFTDLASAEAFIDKENYKPDLIISDYRLKHGVTGLDAIQTLQSKFNEQVPALIISGDTDPKLLEKIHLHDYYLLHKPVKAMQLKKVIRILVL